MKKSSNLLQGEVLDLSTQIAIINPTDTPLLSAIRGRGQVKGAKATTVQWREEALNTTALTGALEGAAAPTATLSTRTMKNNNCMILTKSAEISDTLMALNPEGVGDELSRQVTMRLTEINIASEVAMLSSAKAAESGSTPRKMDGLMNLAASTIAVGGPLTEDKIKAGFKKVWDKGQATDQMVLYVAPDVYEAMVTILDAKTTTQAVEGVNTLGKRVVSYMCEYGMAAIMLNRHMAAGTMLLVDLAKVEIKELRAAQAFDLAKNGDSSKVQIVYEPTIVLSNTYAACSFTGIAKS